MSEKTTYPPQAVAMCEKDGEYRHVIIERANPSILMVLAGSEHLIEYVQEFVDEMGMADWKVVQVMIDQQV